MKNKTFIFILLALLLVAILVLFLYFFGSQADISPVLLPDAGDTTVNSNPAATHGPGLTVTAENVQAVIRALERPESYSRTATLTQYADAEHFRESLVTVWKDQDKIRILQLDASESRNTLLLEDKLYIWYGSEDAVFTGQLQPLPPNRDDLYQGIPSYEDVLALAPEDITNAAYTQWGGWPCILAETRTGTLGYTTRYYVSTEYGLLVGYELLDGEMLLRSFTADSLDPTAPTADIFALPSTLE